MASPANPPDWASERDAVDALVKADKEWIPSQLADEAIRLIRKRFGSQRADEPLIDELSSSLACKESDKKDTQVNSLVLSALYALHACTRDSPDDPPPPDPALGHQLADSVNDTLLMAVFVVLIFESPEGCRTRVESLADASSISLRFHTRCPKLLLELAAWLQEARITIRAKPKLPFTDLTIPLT